MHCPYCQFLLIDDGSLAGQVVACPNCGGHLTMPGVAGPVVDTSGPEPIRHTVTTLVHKKDPGVAALLSFMWAGLGHIYAQGVIWGLIMAILYAFFVAAAFAMPLPMLVPWFVFWVAGIFTAYSRANYYNKKQRRRRRLP